MTHEIPQSGEPPIPPPPVDVLTPRRSAREEHLERVFRGTDREILQRLADGDPLRLEERCARRIRDRALLVDGTRVWRLACAEVARLAARDGAPRADDGAAWLTARIDTAIEEILRMDHAAERAGLAPEEGDADFEALHQALALAWGEVRRALVAFNGLPESTRRTFLEVVIEARPLDPDGADGAGSGEKLRKELQSAVRALYDPDAIERKLLDEESER